ncbi:MAG TPA: hypothetical protein VFA10_14425 [Ktedonobacteraceae bacterium]|nr:hypothetical protein [Ktedonobacteraceae bacterium]
MTGREIYDQQIAPLLEQIDMIATQNGIAYVAAFQYAPDCVVMSCALKALTHRSLRVAQGVLEQAVLWDAEEVRYTQL